jgi:hypothetical protein
LEFDRGSTSTISDPRDSIKRVQSAIKLQGNSEVQCMVQNESLMVNVPEGHSVITADELNDDINQVVSTIVKVIDC